MVTIACAIRINFIELPYIKCFLDHYLSIGISRFYIANTSPNEENKIVKYLSDYNKYIFLINIPENINLHKAYNFLLEHIEEKYTLIIDVDEFLDIYPPNKIQNVINDKYNYYKFKWLFYPNENDTVTKNGYAFIGTASKSMVLTKAIKSIGDHDSILNNGIIKKIKSNTPYLVHYWGRSFNDILLKSIYGKFNDNKKSSYDDIIQNISKNTIPPRLKLLALLMVLKKYKRQIKIGKDLMIIDLAFEKKLLEIMPAEKIEKLKSIYHNYKKNKINNKHLIIYRNVKTLLNIIPLLPE